MKNAGWVLSLLGLFLGVYALFFMDVSVMLQDGTRINNIGLLSQRQNLVIISVVLFVGGIILSSVTIKKPLPDIKYKEINEFETESFLMKEGDGYTLNVERIDELSLTLLKKHGRASINEILLMNSPFLDSLVISLPENLRKSFRSKLTERLRNNS